MEPVVLSYTIDGDNFTAAGTASSEMKRVLRSLGVDAEAIRRAAICMYEGEINMVIHADGGKADVVFDGQGIRIVLQDNGPGIADISHAMQEGYSTASALVRDLGFGAGMGLPNMRKYSNEFELSSAPGAGTTVTMLIRLDDKG